MHPLQCVLYIFLVSFSASHIQYLGVSEKSSGLMLQSQNLNIPVKQEKRAHHETSAVFGRHANRERHVVAQASESNMQDITTNENANKTVMK